MFLIWILLKLHIRVPMGYVYHNTFYYFLFVGLFSTHLVSKLKVSTIDMGKYREIIIKFVFSMIIIKIHILYF